MLQGPIRLAVLAAVLAFGAMGVALALFGLGLPFLLAALFPAIAAGLVQYAALRQQTPDRNAEQALAAELEAHSAATARMRHDLRGILSPALMMSDRLLRHDDPAVKRAGQAVVRSIERATVALSVNKVALDGDAPGGSPAPATGAATPPAP